MRLVLIVLSFVSCFAQKKKQPKLVVGIVVDQMRYDYLIRFSDKYGENGFKKLIKKGYHLENAHYNYIPTYTAVGHSSIYTGTTPENHGVIGNNWYDKSSKKSIYCVDDDRYHSVGTSSKSGQKSPHRLQTTSITDQLYLAQNRKAKTIGIAIKDRSAILPVGHTATAAYWYEGGDKGKWITSSYYMDKLPDWVVKFNNNGKANKYLNKPWETYYNINTYTESIADNNPYEGLFIGEESPVFPHDLPKLRAQNGNFDLLKIVPFGNTFTTDFAEAAIIGEELGKDAVTDFISISYSSTDYIGHKYGVDSKEIEDAYIRMDKEIERLLSFLDKQIGKENYSLFLTADHAVAQTPNYLKKLKIPAGYFDNAAFEKFVNKLCLDRFHTDSLIENISNYQIFINKKTLKQLNLDIYTVENYIADHILHFENVYKSVTAHHLQNTAYNDGLLSLVQKGYNQKLSGDVIYIPKPNTLSNYYEKSGTSHGTGYSYDTHVPLIFYGFGIKQGYSKKYCPIIDIAPSMANLLQIEFPNGSTGKIIEGLIK